MKFYIRSSVFILNQLPTRSLCPCEAQTKWDGGQNTPDNEGHEESATAQLSHYLHPLKSKLMAKKIERFKLSLLARCTVISCVLVYPVKRVNCQEKHQHREIGK